MDIDGIEDPFPETAPAEEITPELHAARNRMVRAYMEFLDAASELIVIDKRAERHEDHWGWMIPKIPMQLEIHTHEGPNTMTTHAEIPLDNVLSGLAELRRAAEHDQGETEQ